MRASNIAYPNLRAEMSRINLGIVEMADGMKCNRDTLARKLSKRSPLFLDEAFNIQMTFFPDMNVKYLFEDEALTDSESVTP